MIVSKMTNTPNIEELVGRLVATGKLDEVVERVLQKKKELEKRDAPLDAWFLGPKAEHGDLWLITVDHILRDYIHWRRNYFPQDPIIVNRDRLRTHDAWIESLKFEIDKVLNLLKAHFPIYSPRYNAHMVSEHFPSVVGYFAAMLYNPNNVTEESAPITLELELGGGKWWPRCSAITRRLPGPILLGRYPGESGGPVDREDGPNAAARSQGFLHREKCAGFHDKNT